MSCEDRPNRSAWSSVLTRPYTAARVSVGIAIVPAPVRESGFHQQLECLVPTMTARILALDEDNRRQRARRIVSGRGTAVNPRFHALVPDAMPARWPATVRVGLHGRHGASIEDGPAMSPSRAPK